MLNTVSVALWGFPITFFMMALCLILGRDQIINNLKYVLFRRRGYSFFAFFRPDGRVEEKVLKRDKRIRVAGKTYFWNPNVAYRYYGGGNFYVETNCQPVNIKNLMVNAENPEMANDPSIVDTIVERAFSWGKNSVNPKIQMDKFLLYALIIGFAGLGYMIHTNTGTLEALIQVVQAKIA